MTNRLSRERSPYLLQHQNNPVDWYPWGEEAFAKAKELNKLIFLSIGYSTCHWCHVMERESFENEDIAKVMNENFVNIKVDREERPDVDAHYMSFVTNTTGHGGWPLSVFVTPDRKPFFGGTYFRPDDSFSMPGFKSILTIISQEWAKQPEAFIQSSEKALKLLQTEAGEGSSLTKADVIVKAAMEHYKTTFDPIYGGFGTHPKFPQPVNLQFLLDYHNHAKSTTEDESAGKMVMETLARMWHGGIHDHLGMGFHRYSVDRKWHIPHFEKMLYDQGQLLKIYSEAAIAFPHQTVCLKAIDDIVAYVQNNLASPSGAFYCAEDADSLIHSDSKEKREGAFAVWTHAEVTSALGDGLEADIFCSHFDIQPEGNVNPQHDVQGELRGVNVLHETGSVEDTASKFKVSTEECLRSLEACKKALQAIRAQRAKPHLDDKILVNWNALMIQGLIHAFHATSNASHLQSAIKAFSGIKDAYLRTDSLMHTDGISGFAEDYALMISACIDLWEATLDAQYRELAIRLQSILDEQFWDSDGGYFQTSVRDSSLPIRMKDSQDGAEPAANSVAAMNLLRLHLITGKDRYLHSLESIKRFFGSDLASFPTLRPTVLSLLLWEMSEPLQISLFGPSKEALKDYHLALLRLPFKVINSFEIHPTLKIQICRANTCMAPIALDGISPSELVEKINSSIQK